MSEDKKPRTEPYFMVSKPWNYHAPILETTDLAEACRVAAAVSVNRGVSVEVVRIVPDDKGEPSKRASMFTTTAAIIDWRKADPAHSLLLKRFACDLAYNVDDLLQAELEGVTK